ncbi:MAG: HupE/UreJ family protein [Sandaracinaceae bacterium]
MPPICRDARWLCLALVWVASTAYAHRGSTKRLVVESLPDGAEVRVALERVDAAVELGLDEDASADAVLVRGAEVAAWLRDGITVRGEGGACDATAGTLTSLPSADPPEVQLTLRYTCPAPVRDLVLADRTIFEDDAQHEAFVRQRFGSEADARVLRRGRQTLTLGEPQETVGLLVRFAEEGVIHLATGYDHVLFLLSLILTAGGLARREGLKVALRDVAVIVTAFTIGHSLTLVAAALGWVVLPSRWVESTIALSIVLTAALNLARPEARKGLAAVAGGFGLVHGFGFSGVLAELGLPAQARVASLLAFNVGIELAQLAFVGVFLLPLAWVAKDETRERWMVRGGSALIAMVALYWFIERAFLG